MPPAPPPVFVASCSFDPLPHEHDQEVLSIRSGESYGEVLCADLSPGWKRVKRLGHAQDQAVGWVRHDMLVPYEETSPSIEAEMIVSGSQSTSFDPFLGSWEFCMKMLSSVAGLWADDRGRFSKKYVMTAFPKQGYANVLTELPDGGHLRGCKLVKPKKIFGDIYAIFWSDCYVLNREACNKTLQWHPISEKSRLVWRWKKKV